MMYVNQRKVGVILSYAIQFAKILISVIYTPVMLRLMGQNEFGLYQLVFSVVSYLSLLSLGFSSSYIRFYSRYKANNDQDSVARLNAMFLLIFISLSIVCMLCGSIMLCNIKFIFGNSLTDSEYSKAKILMLLLIFNLALTFINSVFTSVITAHERFIFQKILILLQSIFSPLLSLPLLIMGYGSIGLVSVTTILTVIVLLMNIHYSIYTLQISFLFKGFQFCLLKEMSVFTFFIFLNQIIDQINWNVDKYLLGRLIGTTAVAVYGIGGIINSVFMEFSTSVSNVFVPKVNSIISESVSNRELTKLFTKVGRIQFIIIGLVLSGFIIFGEQFIIIWAGPDYADSYMITVILVTSISIPLIQNLGIEIQFAKNMHKMRSIVYLIISIVNIIISIPLIKHFGTVGAAIGTAVSLFAGPIVFMNWYYHAHIGINMLYFWKEIVSFAPAFLAPCVTGTAIIKLFNLSDIVNFGLSIILYILVYSFSMFFLGMNAEERRLVIEPIKKLVQYKNSRIG